MANPKEAKQKLELVLKSGSKLVPFLHGAPGIGKSSIVKQVADENGLMLIDLRLSQHEASDIKGIPFPDSKENISRWLPPEFIPFKSTKKFEGTKGILFLDELNRAAPDVLQTVFQLVLDRKVGELELHDDWHIVAAGNLGEEDGCDVIDLDPALESRFIHIYIEPHLESWLEWARKNDVHPDVITFLESHPAHLFEKIKDKSEKERIITPRNWEAFSTILKNNSNMKPEDVANLIGFEVIGTSVIPFMRYLEEKKTIKPQDILENYDKIKKVLKSIPREQIHALNHEIVSYVKSHKKFKKEHYKNFHNYINEVLEKDIKISVLQQLARLDDTSFIDKYFSNYEEEAEQVIRIFTMEEENEENKNS